jgi:hypothetical protein
VILERLTGFADQWGRKSRLMSLSDAALMAFHLAFGVLCRQPHTGNMLGR